MSKTEILAELPRLSIQDRSEIFAQLCHLDEASGPSANEQTMLNEAQLAYNANPTAGAPWPEVEARLRRRS